MYVASPTLRGDAGCGRRGVLFGFWRCCAIVTLAYQLAMRGLGTARVSAEQRRCKDGPQAGARDSQSIMLASCKALVAIKACLFLAGNVPPRH